MVSSGNLALSVLFYLAAATPRTMRAEARSSNKHSNEMIWKKPADGETFGPGGLIVGEWTSSKAIVSPSVSLCSQASSDDDGIDTDADCGGAVWPEVNRTGETYTFSM